MARSWKQFAEVVTRRAVEKQQAQGRFGIYRVQYIPEYRYLGFSGDGLLQFRGVISTDGKTIMIVAVNADHNISRTADAIYMRPGSGEILLLPLQARMIVSPEIFADCVYQYTTMIKRTVIPSKSDAINLFHADICVDQRKH